MKDISILSKSNPEHREIPGLRGYPWVSDIEGPLYLVLIFISVQAVPQTLEDSIKKEGLEAIKELCGFA